MLRFLLPFELWAFVLDINVGVGISAGVGGDGNQFFKRSYQKLYHLGVAARLPRVVHKERSAVVTPGPHFSATL